MTVTYSGTGQYFLGIPNRTLTDEEFAALSEADQAMILASGIYTQDAPEAPAPQQVGSETPVRWATTKKAATSIEQTPEQPAAPTSGG